MKPTDRNGSDMFRHARLDRLSPDLEHQIKAAARAAWCEAPQEDPAWSPLMRLAFALAVSCFIVSAGNRASDLTLARWQSGTARAPQHLDADPALPSEPIDSLREQFVNLAWLTPAARDPAAARQATDELLEALLAESLSLDPPPASGLSPVAPKPATPKRQSDPPRASYRVIREERA